MTPPHSTPFASITPDRAYRKDIDGLRALAILSVVFYHAYPRWLPGGFTGVDIFFVISGYLIGGHICAELSTGSFSYLRFYQRRAKRILPAFYAVLLFILAASMLLLSPLETAQTARSAFAATLSASNILFWITANYFTPKTELNPLLMTWSLGVEEQFYAIIPLLLVVLFRLRRAWFLPALLVACALSFFFAWSQLGRSPMLVFYMLPARAWELGIGVALAAVEFGRNHRNLKTAEDLNSKGGLGFKPRIRPTKSVRALQAAEKLVALKGHRFSRAASTAKLSWALAPEGSLSQIKPHRTPFSAACLAPEEPLSPIPPEISSPPAASSIRASSPATPAPSRLQSAPPAQLLSAIGLALLLAPVFLLTTATPFPGPAALPSTLGTALLIAVPASWINRRLLSLPPLPFIGRISYSWYLWHWPLLAFLRIVCGDRPPAYAAASVIAASFAAGVLSYFFIEQPFRSQPFRQSHRLPAPLLVRYALVSGALLALCGAVWLSKGLPQRFPALAGMESAEQSLKSDPCLVGETDEPNLTLACFRVSPDGYAVAVWGDSHAAALAPGLRAAANAHGYGLIELAKPSCPPLTGATHYLAQVPLRAAACMRFNRRSLSLLESDRRVRIVILAASWAAPFNRTWLDGWLTADLAHPSRAPSLEDSRLLFAQSLTASIHALQAAGKQVILFQDVPDFEVDPLWKVESQRIPLRRKLTGWLRIANAGDPGFASPRPDPNVDRSTALLQQAADLTSAALVDLNSAVCSTPTQCAYRSGENMLYTDTSHLSTDGALFALRNFQFPAADGTIQPLNALETRH